MKKFLIPILSSLSVVSPVMAQNAFVATVQDRAELVLIFVAVICGVVSASYFYLSTDIFINLLQKPLKYIASGMFIISLGVLMAAFISYESKQGIEILLFGVPMSVYFYILYIIGSVLILIGARKFTHRPPKLVQESI